MFNKLLKEKVNRLENEIKELRSELRHLKSMTVKMDTKKVPDLLSFTGFTYKTTYTCTLSEIEKIKAILAEVTDYVYKESK